MSAPYRDQYATVNGCKLHYQEWGDSAARPLIMVHGITSQSHAFDPVAEWLSERYRCLALNVRGHGDSERADPGTYNFGQYAEDILAFMDQLEISSTAYLGTSMGGVLAMMLAGRAPERFDRLALNDIGPESGSSGVGRISSTFSGSPKFSSIEEYVEKVTLAYTPRLKTFPMAALVARARWSVRQNNDGTYGPKFDPRVLGSLAPRPGDRKSRAGELWESFRAMEFPLLLVRGGDSDILTPEIAAAMREAQPNMEFVEVPGVGHTPGLVEKPAREALEKFFA